MATMNISLPGEMKLWVEQQSATGNYSNSSDYVRDLIRKDKVREEKIAHLQSLITEGVESGTGKRSMDELKQIAFQQLSKNKI